MSTSIFLIPPTQTNSNPQTSFTYIKSLIENPAISKYTSISQLTSYITYNNSTIYELDISSIPTFDFIDKIRTISPKIKTIPSTQIRSLIIKGVNKVVPLVDMFTVLAKVTTGVKRVSRAHHPNVPGLGLGLFLVEYSTHENAMEALVVINSKKKLNCIKGNIEAFVAEPLVDNLKQVVEQECTVLAFENINSNVIDAFEFKSFIENFLYEKNECNITIKKLRQYFTRILIEFNQIPKSLKKYINQENCYLVYNNRNISVKYMMKPCVNIGKYKERNLKLSCYSLSEEDKVNISTKLEKKGKAHTEETNLKRKAEAIYYKLVQEEKKEIEKEREREREEYNRHNKKREREHSDRKRYSSHERSTHSKRRNDDSNQRFDKNSNGSSTNQGNSSTIDLSHLTSLLQGNQLTQLTQLNQLIQLLANPNININQLLVGDQGNQLPNINLSQLQSSQKTSQQSINPQQIQPNLLQIPNLQYQNQQSNINSLLSNSSVLALLQSQDPNNVQTQNQLLQNQTSNLGNSQPNPHLNAQQQTLNSYNSMMNIPKLIPNPLQPIDMHQSFYIPPGGKNYYAPPGSQLPHQQGYSYQMGDMFLNPYQIQGNIEQNQPLNQNPSQNK